MVEPSQRPEPGAQQDLRAEIRRLIQESEAAQDAPAQAMEICQRAVFLAERAGPDFEIELADSLRQRGILYSLISDYDAALKDYAQTYMIYDGHGDQKGIAILYDLTSVIFAAVGLYPEALQGFLTSYEYFRHDEDPTWKVQLLNNIGYAYLLLKDPGAGMPYMEECLRMLDANHQRKILASTLDSLAHAYRMIGDHKRALETILKAVQAGRDNNSNFEVAECLCGAGKIYQAMGQAELAISSLEQAVQIAKELGFRRIEAEALFNLGESLIQLGQFEHSLESAQRSLAIAQETGLQPLIYDCFRLLGEIC
jgi:tetratricopeptide (TPR) repeat protein